jgi:transcriptional regulator with XRE-family HTH domain
MSINAKKYLTKMLGELTFSDMIHSLRKTEGFTQQEVADGIGEPRSRVCDFEKGRRIPTLEQAKNLAIFFGYPESFFYKRVFEDQARNAGIDLEIEVVEKSA